MDSNQHPWARGRRPPHSSLQLHLLRGQRVDICVSTFPHDLLDAYRALEVPRPDRDGRRSSDHSDGTTCPPLRTMDIVSAPLRIVADERGKKIQVFPINWNDNSLRRTAIRCIQLLNGMNQPERASFYLHANPSQSLSRCCGIPGCGACENRYAATSLPTMVLTEAGV